MVLGSGEGSTSRIGSAKVWIWLWIWIPNLNAGRLHSSAVTSSTS